MLDASGSPAMPLVVGIPGISGSSLPSTPTGIVFNPIAQDFIVRGTPAQFVFATEDGTVSTWAEMNGNLPTDAILARDDSAQGAVYKGLAILTPLCCREFLALADFHAGLIATYDVSFNPLGTLGFFKDPNLPAGYAPFNIQQIGTEEKRLKEWNTHPRLAILDRPHLREADLRPVVVCSSLSE